MTHHDRDDTARHFLAAHIELRAPLCSVHAGHARPFGPRGQLSAIDKHPLRGVVGVTRNGLAGDEQGDTRHHGGLEKALHHYPFEHYKAWREEFLGFSPVQMAAGGFGENFSTIGLTETNVCIGDIFVLSDAVLQVSQGRQPCWKLNVRFGRGDMAKLVQTSGRTGWYYRVLQEGSVTAGDILTLRERPQPDWPLRRVIEILYQRLLDRSALKHLADMDCLAESWRRLFRRRLETGQIEDWSSRIAIPSH